MRHRTAHPPVSELETWIAARGGVRIMGDVHGNFEDLVRLCESALAEGLGVLLLGDLINRGARSVDCASYAAGLLRDDAARIVPGNHDQRLAIMLRRPDLLCHVEHRDAIALSSTFLELTDRPADIAALEGFVDAVLDRPVWLSAWRTWFAHAALPLELRDRPAPRLRDLLDRRATRTENVVLWGQRASLDEPLLYGWADGWPEGDMAVTGHWPVAHDAPRRRTGAKGGICLMLDTGSGGPAALGGIRPGRLSHIDLTPDDLAEPARSPSVLALKETVP